ncbi:MAG: type I methionyl aminopeptidase [Candidatus Omnitrophota bacterium]|jgi:methionyl aminopeptidase
MIAIKSEKDLEVMRKAGKILARILQRLTASVGPGMSTADLADKAQEFMREEKVVSAFKGYKGYPGVICTSLNEEVVHGIPSVRRKIKDGDILSLDAGIKYEGCFSDAAVTLPVGRVGARCSDLMKVTRDALLEGIRQAVPDNRLYDISYAIQSYAEKYGFSIVRQFVGHGIGKSLHEDPEVPNFGRPHQGEILKSGMVLAIEPMVNMGTWECRILEDGWTAITSDGEVSAHFEHTVAITEHGPEILTQ